MKLNKQTDGHSIPLLLPVARRGGYVATEIRSMCHPSIVVLRPSVAGRQKRGSAAAAEGQNERLSESVAELLAADSG